LSNLQGFTVYLADDPLTNAGIASIFPNRVIGSTSNGFQALEDLARLRPTVAIIGTCLPDTNCQHVIRSIDEGNLGVSPILICCGCHSVDIVESIGNGLMGFILKSSSLQSIRDVVGRVARGETVLHDAHAKLVSSLREGTRPSVLTKREKEIIEFLADGLTVKQIAARVFIAEPTVKFHTRNIYSKLGVNNKGAAVRVAMKEKIIN